VYPGVEVSPYEVSTNYSEYCERGSDLEVLPMVYRKVEEGDDSEGEE